MNGLRAARKKAGLTQVAVAAALGVDHTAITLWEAGKTKPRAGRLPVLAAMYGCTVDELLKEENDAEGTTGT